MYEVETIKLNQGRCLDGSKTYNRFEYLNTMTTVGEVPPLKENVNHPSHYTQGDIECIDAIKAATVGKSGIEAVYVSQVIKYVWRYEEKNGVEDIRKAEWYLKRLIKEVKEREQKEQDERA